MQLSGFDVNGSEEPSCPFELVPDATFVPLDGDLRWVTCSTPDGRSVLLTIGMAPLYVYQVRANLRILEVY